LEKLGKEEKLIREKELSREEPWEEFWAAERFDFQKDFSLSLIEGVSKDKPEDGWRWPKRPRFDVRIEEDTLYPWQRIEGQESTRLDPRVRRCLSAAVKKFLTPNQIEAFNLLYVHGMSQAEAAERLNIGRDAIADRVRRVRDSKKLPRAYSACLVHLRERKRL